MIERPLLQLRQPDLISKPINRLCRAGSNARIPATHALREVSIGEQVGAPGFIGEGETGLLSRFARDVVRRGERSKGDRVGVKVVQQGAVGLVAAWADGRSAVEQARHSQ